MTMKIFKSKSGKTACQVEYFERAICSYFRLEDLEWHYMDQENLAFEEKWVINEFVRKRLEEYDKLEVDLSESLFSLGLGMME